MSSGHSSVVERLVANEKVVGSNPIARSKYKGKKMSDLANKKCIPCEGGIPSFDIGEIHKYLKKVDGWDVKSDDDKTYYLIKEFKFNNFFLDFEVHPSHQLFLNIYVFLQHQRLV